MKRRLPYITVGRILEELKEKHNLSISRVTYYKLEKQGVFTSNTTAGRWRVYTPAEAAAVVQAILENYRLKEPEGEI